MTGGGEVPGTAGVSPGCRKKVLSGQEEEGRVLL